MLIVHVRRPIGEDVRHFRGIADAKGKIDVRPPIFASGGRRASDCSTTDALVTNGVL